MWGCTRETDKAYQAFVTYRNLDPRERSLSRVVSEWGKSRGLIERWSSQWSWVERAREWDNYQVAEAVSPLSPGPTANGVALAEQRFFPIIPLCG